MRAKLAAARYNQGWSQEEVAERVGVTRGTISGWEQGRTQPYPTHVQRLCTMYGKAASELDLEKTQLDTPTTAPVLPSSSQNTGEESKQENMNRRTFLHIPLVLGGYTSYPQLKRNLEFHQTLESYQSLLPAYWTTHFTSSRPETMDEIETIIRDLCQCLIYGPVAEQTKIATLLGGYHQFASELARDHGHFERSLEHADLCVLIATKTDNHELLAGCLYRRGLTHFDLDEKQAAANDLKNALPFVNQAHTQLQGMVTLEAARFQAHLEPDKQVKKRIDQLLDQIQTLVHDPRQEDEGYVRLDKGRYAIGRAATLLALNQPVQSRQELDRAAILIPKSYKRRHAYITIVRARTHFVEGNFDYAADLAMDAARNCIAIHSKSNLADIARLYASLTQTSLKNAPALAQLGIILRPVS